MYAPRIVSHRLHILTRISIVAVTLLNGVVQLELQRRQNSTKARALILQMADMMGALLVGHLPTSPWSEIVRAEHGLRHLFSNSILSKTQLSSRTVGIACRGESRI